MNKKDIAAIRKEFKQDSYKLNLKEMYSAYVKKDGGSILHSELSYFESFDSDNKDLYFANFKKVLSSAVDTKIFELGFIGNGENSTNSILFSALNCEDKSVAVEELNKIVNKILDNYKYETDVVLTFIFGEYYLANSNRNIDADEGEDDVANLYKFVLTTINKVEFPKKNIVFDYESRKITANSNVEVVINLTSPLDGFLFPVLTEGYSDVNKILYYTGKPKELNSSFVENVLNCNVKLTAQDEKECFHSILASVLGEKVKTNMIQDIYTALSENVEEDVDTIGAEDIKRVLRAKGIEESNQVDAAFDEFCGSKCNFRVNNIIPDLNTKSIKISSELAEITITPRDLSMVKQVRDKTGKKCLLIEINDDMEINGLRLETEEVDEL
jgi:hypothetical protein